ncbi:MAG: hypothetical protein AAGD40_10760, partial [Pseudomonadota bacterium]
MRLVFGGLAVLLFFGAALLSATPALPENPVPRAGDVGAARLLAIKTYIAVRNENPAPLTVRAAELESAARLAAHGI